MPCYAKKHKDGMIYLCGDLGGKCNDCSWIVEYLCDYPVGNDLTCDAELCADHATEIAPNTHYCSCHTKMWDDFVKKGLVDKFLKNVVPYKKKGDENEK